MNINYKNIFLALVAALLIAVPTAAVLKHKNDAIQKSNELRSVEIEKRESDLEKLRINSKTIEDQLKQKTIEADELKKQNDQLQKDLQAKAERKAEQERLAAAQAAVSVQTVSGSCRDAIAQTWPSHLQSGAITVMTHENRSENPAAIGAVNNDGHGSQDFGCFQINNYWHKNFFASNDWRDPVANARYAYSIYQGRGNWSAWYAVQGILW